jgi:LAO/AO transport system kinase
VALCEAAGFDVILIETVGVGQSETVVAQLCDVFLLLLAPAGGDELQGVKRGIMEMADLLLINKADGALLPTANRTLAEYAGALRLLRHRPQDPEGYPAALTVSALENRGLDESWAAIRHLIDWRRANGHFAQTRAEQSRHWFAEEVRQGLLSALSREPAKGLMQSLGDRVAQGAQTPEAAAAELLRLLGR